MSTRRALDFVFVLVDGAHSSMRSSYAITVLSEGWLHGGLEWLKI